MKTNLVELDKLEKYLKKEKIPYVRIDERGSFGNFKVSELREWGDSSSLLERYLERHQIIVPNKQQRDWDVICQPGSYGFEEGLLEIMGCIVNQTKTEDTVEGYLTAEDVIERIKIYDKN